MPELARFAVVAQRGEIEQKITSTGAHGRSGQMASGHRRRDKREEGVNVTKGRGKRGMRAETWGPRSGDLRLTDLKLKDFGKDRRHGAWGVEQDSVCKQTGEE
jgi:hypothetical protein